MTTLAITPETVLLRAAHCVMRQQEHSFLLYNPRTDELHLLPPAAYLVYAHCDGLNAAADIEAMLSAIMGGQRGELREKLYGLLEQLTARGLLELEEPC